MLDFYNLVSLQGISSLCPILAPSHEQVQLENKSPTSSQTQLAWRRVPYLLPPPHLPLLPLLQPIRDRSELADEGVEFRALAPPNPQASWRPRADHHSE
jgi:hypothetical protein